jgi:hypothetical protein
MSGSDCLEGPPNKNKRKRWQEYGAKTLALYSRNAKRDAGHGCRELLVRNLWTQCKVAINEPTQAHPLA